MWILWKLCYFKTSPLSRFLVKICYLAVFSAHFVTPGMNELQQQPHVWKLWKFSRLCNTLELRLLDEAAFVIVEDLEDILDLLGRLWGQATQTEELLVAEWVRNWKGIHLHVTIKKTIQTNATEKKKIEQNRTRTWLSWPMRFVRLGADVEIKASRGCCPGGRFATPVFIFSNQQTEAFSNSYFITIKAGVQALEKIIHVSVRALRVNEGNMSSGPLHLSTEDQDYCAFLSKLVVN